MAETKKAFKKLPNIENAMTALSNLKGVGTATASALLAAASPENAPFMADECVQAIPEMEGSDYTAKEYLNFVTHIQSVCDRLNKVRSHAFSFLFGCAEEMQLGTFDSMSMTTRVFMEFYPTTAKQKKEGYVFYQ